MGGFQTGARFANRVFYRFADRLLCIETYDESRTAIYHAVMGDWHFSLVEPTLPQKACATISVRLRDHAPLIPKKSDGFEIAAGGNCKVEGSTYFLEDAGSLIVVRPGRECLVEVYPAEAAGACAQARMVFNSVSAALRRCGLYELHGAGVVNPSNGEGALIIGPSGSGKSTLALQLAVSGWGYLSDDTLLLSVQNGMVEARPLRRAFAVTDSTLDAVGMSHLKKSSGPASFLDPIKHRFSPQDAFPQGRADACIPRALFFPSITNHPRSRARELSKFEATAALLRSCPWACYDGVASRGFLKALTGLARQSRAYELSSGTDLLADPAYAAGFLAARMKVNVDD